MKPPTVESRLADWLLQDRTHAPDAVLETALARTRQVRQRRRWRLALDTGAGEWAMALGGLRLVAAAVVVLAMLAALLLIGVLIGSPRRGVLPPSPTPFVSASPAASALPSPSASESASSSPTLDPVLAALPTPPPGNEWASIHWSMPDPTAFAGPHTFLANVVSFGGGFAAVGQDDQGGTLTAVVWLSPDGRRWDRLEGGEAFAGFYMAGVAAGPSGLVATGGSARAGAAAWRSTDGRVWVREASSTAAFRGPTAVGPTGVIGTVGFGQLAFASGASKWEELAGATDVADLADVWGDPSIFTVIGSARGADRLCHARASWSVDGRVWAPASIADPGLGFAYATSALGGVLVQGVTGSCASGATPTGLWFSPDGKDYRSVAVSAPLPADWCAGAYSARCLVGDGNRMVLVGPNGDVAFSEDGATWWRSASTIEGSETFDPQAQGYVALAVGKPGIVVAVTDGVNVQRVWLGEPGVP